MGDSAWLNEKDVPLPLLENYTVVEQVRAARARPMCGAPLKQRRRRPARHRELLAGEPEYPE
jgi:hypothetical protein